MNFDVVGATGNQSALVGRALAAFGYPVDALIFKDVTVTIAFVVEPSFPGTEEFAAATQTAANKWLIEVRNNLDQLGRDPEGIYEGPEFFMDTVIHEMGHVIAGIRLSTPEKRAAATACFERKNREPGYPATPSLANWSAGDWQEHVQESVAETVKDAWLPLGIRAYDNRTSWVATAGQWRTLMALLLPAPTNAFGAQESRAKFDWRGDTFRRLNLPFGGQIINRQGPNNYEKADTTYDVAWIWGNNTLYSEPVKFTPEAWDLNLVDATAQIDYSYDMTYSAILAGDPIRAIIPAGEVPTYDLYPNTPSLDWSWPKGWGASAEVGSPTVLNRHVVVSYPPEPLFGGGRPGYQWTHGVVGSTLDPLDGMVYWGEIEPLWWDQAIENIVPGFTGPVNVKPFAYYNELKLASDGRPLIQIGIAPRLHVLTNNHYYRDPGGLNGFGSVEAASMPSGPGVMEQWAWVETWSLLWSFDGKEYDPPPYPYNDLSAVMPGPVLRVRRSTP